MYSARCFWYHRSGIFLTYIWQENFWALGHIHWELKSIGSSSLLSVMKVLVSSIQYIMVIGSFLLGRSWDIYIYIFVFLSMEKVSLVLSAASSRQKIPCGLVQGLHLALGILPFPELSKLIRDHSLPGCQLFQKLSFKSFCWCCYCFLFCRVFHYLDIFELVWYPETKSSHRQLNMSVYNFLNILARQILITLQYF